MTSSEIFAESFDSAWRTVNKALEGMTQEELTRRPTDQANPIGWVVWHMYRVQDIVIHGVMQRAPAVWITNRWYEKYGLPDDPMLTGGRQTSEEVGAFQCPSRQDLIGYASAVQESTMSFLKGTSDAALQEKVKFFGNERKGVEALTFIIGEMHQHAGHVSYIRGLIRGLNA